MENIKIIESIAIIVASLSAAYGIFSWRREIEWRKKYEIAEEVLTLFYEARDKIHEIRSPGSYHGGGQSRKPDSIETDEEKEALDQSYIVFERYQKNQEIFNRLYAFRYRFMTIFGQDNTKPFDKLRNILKEIFFATDRLGRLWQSQTNRQVNKYNKNMEKQIEEREKRIENYQNIIWEDWGDSDPITPKVKELVKEIENICEKIVRPEPWFSKVFRKLKKTGKEKDKK